MSRSARLIIGGIAAVLVVALLGLIFILVSGGDGTASATLSAPTLDLSTPATAPTDVPATQAATDEATESAMADATAEPTSAPAEETPEALQAEATPEAAAELVVFNLETEDSEVRFILDEMLRGSLNTVTGRTDQIAGQIAVDFANPQNSRVGEIRISARSLRTDNEFRDRAIRGQILQSAQDEFEFISFVPTEMEGLPAEVTMGEPFEFTLTGDLTIRDITEPATFTVTVTPVSETRIEGLATATVQRTAYGLEIPSVPSVADVDEAVRLEITFVAVAAE